MSLRTVTYILAAVALVSIVAIPCTGAPTAQPFDLRSVVARVLEVDPSMQAARQQLAQAQAQAALAAAEHQPQVTFNGSVSGSHGQVAEPVSTQTYGTVEGTVSLALPNGKRLSALGAKAVGMVRAAQANLTRTRLLVAFAASNAYYGVLRARSGRDIAAEDLAQAEREVADTQKRANAGDLPQSDVLKAQVPVAQARVALARAQSAVLVAEQALDSLLGCDLAAPLNLPEPGSPAAAEQPTSEAVALAVAQSPDVREAQANVDAAQAAVDLARHAHDPEWAVAATHTRTSDITAYSSLTTLMLNVTLPLADGGAARDEVRQAQAQLAQAKSALTIATRDTRLAIEQAWLEVAASQAAVVGTKETLRIADESLAKAQQAFQAGLTTTRDVLLAQVAVAQARSDASNAVYDLAVALARLEQAMGKEPTL